MKEILIILVCLIAVASAQLCGHYDAACVSGTKISAKILVDSKKKPSGLSIRHVATSSEICNMTNSIYTLEYNVIFQGCHYSDEMRVLNCTTTSRSSLKFIMNNLTLAQQTNVVSCSPPIHSNDFIYLQSNTTHQCNFNSKQNLFADWINLANQYGEGSHLSFKFTTSAMFINGFDLDHFPFIHIQQSDCNTDLKPKPDIFSLYGPLIPVILGCLIIIIALIIVLNFSFRRIIKPINKELSMTLIV
ncbi:hypothetical protein WA158_007197 [Blastocystis sp. Blastoise]